jgi:hypothetical protein
VAVKAAALTSQKDVPPSLISAMHVNETTVGRRLRHRDIRKWLAQATGLPIAKQEVVHGVHRQLRELSSAQSPKYGAYEIMAMLKYFAGRADTYTEYGTSVVADGVGELTYFGIVTAEQQECILLFGDSIQLDVTFGITESLHLAQLIGIDGRFKTVTLARAFVHTEDTTNMTNVMSMFMKIREGSPLPGVHRYLHTVGIDRGAAISAAVKDIQATQPDFKFDVKYCGWCGNAISLCGCLVFVN